MITAAHRAGVKALRSLVDEVEDICRTLDKATAPWPWNATRKRLERLDRLVKKIRKAEAATAGGKP